MGVKVVVPTLGESIVEATVARWYKKPGESVQVGEPLVELETDKVNLEVGAEKAGILAQILHEEGDDVSVGEVLAEIQETAGEPQTVPSAGERIQEKQEVGEGPKEPAANERVTGPEIAPQEESERPADESERVTPLARRVAQSHGVDPSQVPGSGAGGRVVRQDVERFLTTPTRESEAPPVTPVSPTPPQVERGETDRREERVRLSRRRRTIAQNLVAALQNTAMLTTFNDVDMKAVMDLRARHKKAFSEKYGVSLGIVSFFVKASVLALKDFPQVNSEIDGEELILKRYYDIGIAVGAEEGLVVPVLRDADRASFAEIETTIESFVKKSNEGTLSIDDLRGGTFSITNGGVYGSLLSTPILNYPQVAILGLHRIEERPIVRNGEIEIHPMMYLALSYDHRVIDGREAVQFLIRIKQVIENPEMLFLEL